MIAYIGEWITHIVLLILIATFMDLLIPNNEMKKYVKMVIGLLIIMVILSPILDLFQLDHERMQRSIEDLFQEEQEQLKDQMQLQQEEIESLQDEAILEQVEQAWATEMKKDVRQQLDVDVSDVRVRLNAEGEHVHVVLVEMALSYAEPEQSSEQRSEQKNEQTEEAIGAEVEDGNHDAQSVAVVPSVEPIERIEVEVDTGTTFTQPHSELTDKQIQIEHNLVTYLDEAWNISVDKISFSWTRR